MFSKSPMNYTGGKFRILPQIIPLFPDNVHVFYDLFAGGCDVCTNVAADVIYANDINFFLIDIYKAFQKMTIQELLEEIDETIDRWQLSKTNREGYLALREHYNATPAEARNPIELYVLTCYGFNHQLRFNGRKEFNTPFGKDRSSFNNAMRLNLIRFHAKIRDIHFESHDFRTLCLDHLDGRDFVYADCPYRISVGSYNDGKRGFKGWDEDEDLALIDLLDWLDGKGVRFAMSNVLEHKGRSNDILIPWAEKYRIHEISSNYANSSYHAKNTGEITREVLITNY